MLVIVGNKLPHDVIVTLVLMPKPQPERPAPARTLFIFVSLERATIDRSVREMGDAGLVIADETLAPGGVFRKRDAPDAANVRAESEDVLQQVSALRSSLSVHEGVKTCQVTVVPSGRSAARGDTNVN